jgi:hypothetical protein
MATKLRGKKKPQVRAASVNGLSMGQCHSSVKVNKTFTCNVADRRNNLEWVKFVKNMGIPIQFTTDTSNIVISYAGKRPRIVWQIIRLCCSHRGNIKQHRSYVERCLANPSKNKFKVFIAEYYKDYLPVLDVSLYFMGGVVHSQCLHKCWQEIEDYDHPKRKANIYLMAKGVDYKLWARISQREMKRISLIFKPMSTIKIFNRVTDFKKFHKIVKESK